MYSQPLRITCGTYPSKMAVDWSEVSTSELAWWRGWVWWWWEWRAFVSKYGWKLQCDHCVWFWTCDEGVYLLTHDPLQTRYVPPPYEWINYSRVHAIYNQKFTLSNTSNSYIPIYRCIYILTHSCIQTPKCTIQTAPTTSLPYTNRHHVWPLSSTTSCSWLVATTPRCGHANVFLAIWLYLRPCDCFFGRIYEFVVM